MTSASKYFFSLSGLRAWLGILIADFHTQSDLNIDIVLNNDAVAGHINLQSGLPVLMEYYQGLMVGRHASSPSASIIAALFKDHGFLVLTTLN